MKRFLPSPGNLDLSPGDVAFTYVGCLSLLFLVPFAVMEFADGQRIVAAVETLLAAMILSDVISSHRTGHPLIPREILFTLVTVMYLFLLSVNGMIGIYWTYPIVICLHLVLRRGVALVLNLVLLAGAISMVAVSVELAETARIVTTLLLTSTFAFIFSSAVIEHRARLEEQVVTDSLTGAYNRRYLDRRFAEAVEQKNRYGHTASMILFDIDHFKRINDRHGHHVGDRVLRTVIETVKTRVRVVDQVFRYGGEEFVILLPETGIRQAQKLAVDITGMIESLSVIEGGPVTISCGVAELEAEEAALTWIDRCDKALYYAKRMGRNQVCTTDDAVMDEAALYQAAAT